MEADLGRAIRGRRASRYLALGASMLTVVALAGCGTSNPLNPNPTPTPTPAPSKANVVLTLANIKIDTGTLPGFAYALTSDIHLAENGGVAANIDFIRLDMYSSTDTNLERTQLSGSQIPNGTALAANGVRDFTALGLGFNSDIVSGRYVIVSVGTTDAKGNALVTSSGKLIFG